MYALTGNGYDDSNRKPSAPDAPSLVCVEKRTGKVVWQDASPGVNALPGHYSSPSVVEVCGRAQVIHSQSDGWVRSFDAATGKRIWKFDVNRPAVKDGAARGGWWGDRFFSVATPVYANGRVYVAVGLDPEACMNEGGRLYCIDPTKTGDVSPELQDGPGKGKPNPNSAVVWEFADEGPHKAGRFHHALGSVAVANGFVIATDGFGLVHCLDEKTGKRHWWYDTKGRVYGNALIAEEKVYVTTDDGTAWAFALAKSKRIIAKVEAESSFVAPPVFANGTLYLLSEKTLYAVRKP